MAWPACSSSSPRSAAAERGWHELPSSLAQVREQFHADHDRHMRRRRRLRSLLYSRLSGLPRRNLHQLELLHQATHACWRDRRWYGQRHRRQRQTPLARFVDWRPDWFLWRYLPLGIQRWHRSIHRALRGGPAQWRSLDRHRNFRLRFRRAAFQAFLDVRRRIRARLDDDSYYPSQYRRID